MFGRLIDWLCDCVIDWLIDWLIDLPALFFPGLQATFRGERYRSDGLWETQPYSRGRIFGIEALPSAASPE